MVSSTSKALFLCPHCGHGSKAFRPVCPECGRPFQRDYIDTRVHPRDPDLTGVVTSRFWARVFLVLLGIGAAVGFFMWLSTLF